MRTTLITGGCLAALLAAAHAAAAQGPPPLPLVREGACPFECCMYGPWRARAAIPVFAAERDSGQPAFRLAPGETVEAVTGNVHVRRAATAVFQRPFRLPRTITDTLLFVPGDTIYVLDHISEGVYHVWFRNAPLQMDRQWAYPDEDAAIRADARALADRPPVVEWWVRIRRSDGREGWILLDPTEPARFDGSDACADG